MPHQVGSLNYQTALWAICITFIGLWLLVEVLQLRSRSRRRAASDDLAPKPDFTKLPIDASARSLTPRDCTVFEVSNDVLLSRMANALAQGGLRISNTPRGTLRIHPIPDWTPPEPPSVLYLSKPQAG